MDKDISLLPIFEDTNKMYIKNEDAEKFFNLLNNKNMENNINER